MQCNYEVPPRILLWNGPVLRLCKNTALRAPLSPQPKLDLSFVDTFTSPGPSRPVYQYERAALPWFI